MTGAEVKVCEGLQVVFDEVHSPVGGEKFRKLCLDLLDRSIFREEQISGKSVESPGISRRGEIGDVRVGGLEGGQQAKMKVSPCWRSGEHAGDNNLTSV